MRTRNVVAVLALCSSCLAGCTAVGLTALGVGMGTGVGHHLGGMVYKTFTAPQAQVKRAAQGALGRMQVKVVKSEREGSTETAARKQGQRSERAREQERGRAGIRRPRDTIRPDGEAVPVLIRAAGP